MSQEFKYDVFLSYSAKDKEIVRELAEKLKADGIRVWFDEWIIQPGDAIGVKINEGLEQSRILVLAISANASESDWVTFEHQSILFNYPINKTRRFIPLRLDDSEIQFTLRQFAYIDWREQDEVQYRRFLSAIREKVKTQLLESRFKETQKVKISRNILEYGDEINSIAISSDGKFIVSGSEDKTLQIWDVKTGNCINTLQGHSGVVYGVAISSDDKFIVSGSGDNTVRIWSLNLFDKFEYNTQTKTGIFPVVKSIEEEEKYKFYTNAKVLLVGDSGVGKSGLAHRLMQNKFVETISTDGVWATQMSLPHDSNTDDTEREIWLWDFAGQSDYRLIHQLFMDETSLAVLVFNPQADNPFEGLGQWDRDLQKAARRPFRKLLVAGRCDRGSLTVSRKTLDDFKDEREFAKYLETSALTDEGCQDLREAIIEHINWDEIPYRSSPRIFKLLKEEIIKLKDEGRVLLTLSELKQNLELRLSDEKFTFDEFKTVVGLLAGSGVVWQLEFGDFVLLQPERVNSYAAAVVRSVRAHIDEIGCIAEEKVLKGELDYQDMKRLPEKEEQIVLRAMHQTFIERGLCLRENTDEGVLLIFPSYFRRERPKLDKHPSALVTYQFSGMLDEIYATLVVKLHHTKAFDKDQLWRYAADFKTQKGQRVGLKMTKKPEGAAEITIYFEPNIPEDTKAVFIRYVHDHLKAKDETVVRVRHYVCPHCINPFENELAIKFRLEKGFKDILCPICENRFDLWDLIEEKFASMSFNSVFVKWKRNRKSLLTMKAAN